MILCNAIISFVLLGPVGSMGQGKIRPLTHAEADAALRRVGKIHWGMTMPQMWEAIGLSNRCAAIRLGRGSGPTTRFGMNFELTDVHRLYVEVNSELYPTLVVRAEPVWIRHARR